MTAYLQQLFQIGTYKSKQGRIARQATFIALAVVAAAGCYSLYQWLLGGDGSETTALGIAIGVFAALAWAAYRLIQLPKFAEFLISVEQEMGKVSWPGRGELWRASIVVILTIFVLAGLLYAYDILWREIIGTIMGEETALRGFFRSIFGAQ